MQRNIILNVWLLFGALESLQVLNELIFVKTSNMNKINICYFFAWSSKLALHIPTHFASTGHILLTGLEIHTSIFFFFLHGIFIHDHLLHLFLCEHCTLRIQMISKSAKMNTVLTYYVGYLLVASEWVTWWTCLTSKAVNTHTVAHKYAYAKPFNGQLTSLPH